MCEISAWSVTAAEAGQEVKRDEEFQLQNFLLAPVSMCHFFDPTRAEKTGSAFGFVIEGDEDASLTREA